MKSLALAVLAALVGIVIFVGLLYAGGYRITVSRAEAPSCLEAVQRWSPQKQSWALGLAEDALAAGDADPAAGTCHAERLEWLRENVR